MDRTDAMALFVAAIDAGSLSGASRKIGLSLSSVSRHLTALEERLGTKLVVRTTRALVLTDAGQTYYEAAKRLLAEVDDLEASLTTDAAAPKGPLNVCAPTLFGRVFILPILADFAVRHPAITMDVMLLDRTPNLIEDGIDLAVRIEDLDDSSLIARKLGSLRWVFAASPEDLATRGTPAAPDDLARQDCLLFSQQGRESSWPILVGGNLERVTVPVRMRSNTLDGVVAAAVAGAGIVHAPAWAVADHVAEGRLQLVLCDFEVPHRPISAVFTHNRLLSGKVRALLDALAEGLSGYKLDEVPPFGSRPTA